MELKADPNRKEHSEATGVFVRAKRGNCWDSVDIAELDKESLETWLDSKPYLAKSVLLLILGHSMPGPILPPV